VFTRKFDAARKRILEQSSSRYSAARAIRVLRSFHGRLIYFSQLVAASLTESVGAGSTSNDSNVDGRR
jgi:hypothetical protein